MIVNGSLEGFFGSSRRLRQGNPLSPILFVIVMEAFRHKMRQVILHGDIIGSKVGVGNGAEVCISQLLFVDNTLVLCGAEVTQFHSLCYLQLCFEAVSGLKINLSKFEVIPIVCVHNIQELANILGCRVSSLPMKYLGLPLGARYKSIYIWDDIIERMKIRLARYKHMYLSKGGRITLIKSTLSSLPTYFLSLFPILV